MPIQFDISHSLPPSQRQSISSQNHGPTGNPEEPEIGAEPKVTSIELGICDCLMKYGLADGKKRRKV